MDSAKQRGGSLDASRGRGQQIGAANVQHNWFLTEAAGGVVPRQLPAQLPDLMGREDELRRLDALLEPPHTATHGGAVVISAIAGTAGVGKTSLAVAWGHRQRHHFVDGDLFVNLRGYGPGRPAAPTEVLDLFLRALGVPPKRIPSDLDAQAALYRTLLHDKRVLIVLDNAKSTEQVRPLLPGSPGCLVVVTSRRRLLGLVGANAARLAIDLLSPDEAVALLRSIIGPERADAEPVALAELAQMCAYLPLALRVAGERAAVRPRSRLSPLVADLGRRAALLHLSLDDEEDGAIQAVFTWSYLALSPAHARTFRLLGWHAGPDIPVGAAAALSGEPEETVRSHLDALSMVHMIQEREEDRYGSHDLLAEYARERSLAEDGDGERQSAVRRVLAWYLHTARAANRLIMPQRGPIPVVPLPDQVARTTLTGYAEALAWCETERTNLVLATRQAAEHGLDDIAWQLPVLLRGFFNLRKHWDDWITTHAIALEAATRRGDRIGLGWVLQGLGTAFRQLGQPDRAIDYHRRALALRREIGDRSSIASALDGMGSAHLDAGRADEAIRYYQEGLSIREEIGHRHGEAWSLHNLASSHQQEGNLELAVDLFLRALPIRREVEDKWGEGATLHQLGLACADMGDAARAADYFEHACRLRRQIGDSWGVACSMRGLGEVHLSSGEKTEATAALRESLQLFRALGDPQADDVRDLLAGTGQ